MYSICLVVNPSKDLSSEGEFLLCRPVASKSLIWLIMNFMICYFARRYRMLDKRAFKRILMKPIVC